MNLIEINPEASAKGFFGFLRENTATQKKVGPTGVVSVRFFSNR